MGMTSYPKEARLPNGKTITIQIYYCEACGNETFNIFKGPKDTVPHFICTTCGGTYCGTFDGTQCAAHR